MLQFYLQNFAQCSFFECLAGKRTSHKRKSDKIRNEVTSTANSTLDNIPDDLKVEFYHLNTTDETLEKGIIFRREQRAPCSCLNLNCGCCAGMETQRFKRKRESRQFENASDKIECLLNSNVFFC